MSALVQRVMREAKQRSGKSAALAGKMAPLLGGFVYGESAISAWISGRDRPLSRGPTGRRDSHRDLTRRVPLRQVAAGRDAGIGGSGPAARRPRDSLGVGRRPSRAASLSFSSANRSHKPPCGPYIGSPARGYSTFYDLLNKLSTTDAWPGSRLPSVACASHVHPEAVSGAPVFTDSRID